MIVLAIFGGIFLLLELIYLITSVIVYFVYRNDDKFNTFSCDRYIDWGESSDDFYILPAISVSTYKGDETGRRYIDIIFRLFLFEYNITYSISRE